MGDATLRTAQPFLSGPGISRYLLGGIWFLEVVDLFYPRAELRHAGVIGLALFIGLTLFRASRHLRVLCVALTVVAVSIAAAFGNWGAIPRGLESALIFGAFLPTVLFMRATAEESSVRGVSSAIMWSPFFVAMGVASQLVPTVKLWQIMPVGLSIGLLGLLTAHVMFGRGVDAVAGGLALRPHRARLWHVALDAQAGASVYRTGGIRYSEVHVVIFRHYGARQSLPPARHRLSRFS